MKQTKPTKDELFSLTTRAGRVFLFEYPLKDPNQPDGGQRLPKTLDKITNALLDNLPGCKETELLWTGCVAITIDDTKDNAGDLSDDEIRSRIASIFHQYWRE